MNNDMSQQAYQMLGNRYPALDYNSLVGYAQQFANQMQQNPYYQQIMDMYNNPNIYMNALMEGSLNPYNQQSSSAGTTL